MDSEDPAARQAPHKLPSWIPPAALLAFPIVFYRLVEVGADMYAMVFGMLAIPVMVGALAGVALVISRGAMGDYRGRWSVLGTVLWALVAVVLAASVTGIVLKSPGLGF